MTRNSGLNVDEVKISLQKFGWPDYLVFLIMLLCCVFIGIYFALKLRTNNNKSKQSKDAEDNYLVGGRTMQIFPVTMSLIAR